MSKTFAAGQAENNSGALNKRLHQKHNNFVIETEILKLMG